MPESREGDAAEVMVRDARRSDVAALASVRYAEHPAIHRDRIGDAVLGYVRYLVAERAGVLVGFGLLAFENPSTWAGAASDEFLPQVVDLYVAEALRGQGVGRHIIRHMEMLALGEGSDRLFLSVDPRDNARAHALYLRLGFLPLQAEPHRTEWHYTDSDGHVHAGSAWAIDMVKRFG